MKPMSGTFDEGTLRELLESVAGGTTPIERAIERLKDLPYEDIGLAKLDVHRELRRGFPEVILGERKTPEQVLAIAERLAEHHNVLLATRLQPEAGAALKARFPAIDYHEQARLA